MLPNKPLHRTVNSPVQIDLGSRLAAYWAGGVGSGQRCCWPLNADPFDGAAEPSMVRIEAITVDAEHPAVLARFWAAALEGYSVRGYDEAEIARLAADGLTPETDPTVMIDGPGATLCFQKMPGKTTGRNRWHIDLRGTSRQSEVERLCKLGASVREVRAGWTTLLDPEGNPFCVLGESAV